MRRALAALLLALVAACGAAGSSGSKHTAVAVRAPAKVAPNASTRADRPTAPAPAPPATATPPAPAPPASAPAPKPVVPAPKPVPPPPPAPAPPAPAVKPVLRDISPNAFATNPVQAQALVNAGKLVAEGPPVVPVPTLSGDITSGFGYFSTLPIGSLFTSTGRTYRVSNRMNWATGGGVVPSTLFGGDLVLHTCLPHHSGSTFTWATLVR